MTKLKNITSSLLKTKVHPIHIFIFFVFVHLFLFNINAAEWGDSYRILRASEYVRKFSYPADEKRPPLYSVFLALRPAVIDQVVWGRIEMFVFSLLSFYVFYKILNLVFNKQSYISLALLLFTLNPVYLYWSLRIMADVTFTLWVLIAFYILSYAKKAYVETSQKSQKQWPIILGFTVGLSVLTRFEGYVLFGSIGIGILFILGFEKNILEILKKRFIPLSLYVFTFILTIVPWLFYRNPFNSSYFDEPATRVYNFSTLAIYLLSFLFLFGFIYAFFFLFWNWQENVKFLKNNVGILVFIIFELLLILAWPAAIPRLFVPLVPIFVILLTSSILRYFKSPIQTSKTSLLFVITLFALLAIFFGGQFIYKLQFLVVVKNMFLIIVIFSILQIYSIYKKHIVSFLLSLVVILSVWSYSTIYIHKDIFRVVQLANIYITSNLSGLIGYNDVSSVSDWYLNQRAKNDKISGFYYNAVKKENRDLDALRARNIDYLLITNEHNTDTTIDLTPWPHLKEIKHFEYEINGEVFFTKIVKVEYNK